MTTAKAGKSFTGRKARFLNMAEDGIKLRAVKFKNHKAYDRKIKHKGMKFE